MRVTAMAKRHALIIPSICPIDQYSTSAPSILDYDVYWELKHAALHDQFLSKGFRYYEKRRKVKVGSFGILREGYEGYSLVFLHPYEVLNALRASIIMLSRDGVRVVGFDNLARYGVRSGAELNEFLASKWYKGSILIVSSYIAEASIGNLAIRYRRDSPYEVRYCYGRLDRVVNRIDIDSIIGSSRLIAMPHKVDDPIEKADMLLNVLLNYPPRWPWMNYGLLVDRSRRWVTVLNPDVMNFIDVEYLEELRVMDYVDKPGWEGNYVPIIVVKKLTLVQQLSDYGNRLENVLWKAIQRFKARARGGVWLGIL